MNRNTHTLFEDHNTEKIEKNWENRPLYQILQNSLKAIKNKTLPILAATLIASGILLHPLQASPIIPTQKIELTQKGPYTLQTFTQAEFGDKKYKSQFQISKNEKTLIEKSSTSSINGWEINPENTHYSKKILWSLYKQNLDGLDRRTIHIAKIAEGNIEEAIASYEPIEPKQSLKIEKMPKEWNPKTTKALFEKIVDNPEKPVPLKTFESLIKTPSLEKYAQPSP